VKTQFHNICLASRLAYRLIPILIYVNNVSILKKVKKEEDTALNTIVGSICLVIILCE